MPEGATTCGNSFCQEAAYYANLARNEKNRKKQKHYRKREAECCELARRWK
jgi:hypothetical protein